MGTQDEFFLCHTDEFSSQQLQGFPTQYDGLKNSYKNVFIQIKMVKLMLLTDFGDEIC